MDGLLSSDSEDSDYAPSVGSGSEGEGHAGGSARAPKRARGGIALESDDEEEVEYGEEEGDEEDEEDDREAGDGGEDEIVPANKKKARKSEAGPSGSAGAGPSAHPEKVVPVAVETVAPAVVEADKVAPAAAKKDPIDDLWAQMNAPVAKRAPVASANSAKPADAGKVADAGLAGWLGASAVRPSSAAGTTKGVPRLGDIEEKVRTEEGELGAAEGAGGTGKGAKAGNAAGTGLEAVLGAVKGVKGPGVLDRTRDAWKEFKEEADGDVVDELEVYKKDKNRYTDKVAFLQRTDVREWEVEQEKKRTRR